MEKKCKVVLLPTKISRISKYSNGILSFAKGSHYGIPKEMVPQHLYILSERANENSKFYLDGDLVRLNVVLDKDYWKVRNYPEIIATTNPDLIKEGVASIYDEDIENYCKNPTEFVNIEYNKSYDKESKEFYYTPVLLYNYIIIKPVEETWDDIYKQGPEDIWDFYKWLKQNYEVPKKK